MQKPFFNTILKPTSGLFRRKYGAPLYAAMPNSGKYQLSPATDIYKYAA